MALREHVRIARRFQRAIRIDFDLRDPHALEGFICPKSSAEILLTMGHHVAETGQAAFTWTGPYGSGKSSLVVALSALLSGDNKKRTQAAQIVGRQTANQLWKLLPPQSKGWRVLPVVGRRESPTSVIGEALVAAGLASKPGRNGWTERLILDVLKKLAAESSRARGGLIIFIDEMGKFLEGAASENSDIYIFQQLAELAARSDRRLIVVGVLHQAFEEYSHRLAREQRDEWAKIQGRFIDLVVNTAGEEQLEILARAIESDHRAKKSSSPVQVVAKCISANRRDNEKTLASTLERCWPLHPIVAALLGPISRRRFGQNQRSLFGFLNSAEPNGFQDFLRDADNGAIYTPDELWDYLRVNLEPSILASPDGHRWSSAVEAIERCESLGGDELHLQLLKALALIELFKERSGLLATADVLGECAYGYKLKQINKALNDLAGWSLVIFKRHLGAYAIYAGSDFDINQALKQALEDIREIDFRTLRFMAGFHPVIAKRHYHRTGALRWFDVDLLPANTVADFIAAYRPTRGSMGIFLVPIPTERGATAKLKQLCQTTAETSSEEDIIVGYSPDASRVVELAREVLALAQIQQERPELAGDSVARRELLARFAEAQDQLELVLGRILDNAIWYHRGSKEKTYSSAALSSLASDIADKRFSQSPIIANELLNRLKPSSNARGAQKVLLQRMVLNEDTERLGIDGFPAEGGLFASMLDATGLHQKTNDGWRFVAPRTGGNDPANLLPLWTEADKFLQKGTGRVVSLEELFDVWRARPYGVKDGLLPVLAVAYILSRRENIAFYRESVFQARFTDLDVDYLANDPRDIQLRWLDINGPSQRLLLGMSEIAQESDSSKCRTTLKPIEIARALVATYEELEPWTKRTMRLSVEAVRIRNVFKRAIDPNRLLFDDLPGLVGINTDLASEEGVSEAVALVRNGLRELRDRYRIMLDDLRKLLFKELQVIDSSLASMAILRKRAENVLQVSGDFRLNAFIGRLTQFQGTDSDIEGLASLAANKPSHDWTDPDLNQATLELASFAQQFIRVEAFARVKGRGDKRHAMAVVVGMDGQPTPISHEFSVTDSDQSAIEELIHRVEVTLAQADQQQKNVILAALAELSARYMRRSGDAATKRRKVVGP
jgi:hypothetical protein